MLHKLVALRDRDIHYVVGSRKLTRTIDFLPMSGVTEGCCALRIKTDGGCWRASGA